MLSDLKKFKCLVEGKEMKRERKKSDIKKGEYKDYETFLNK